MILVSLCLGTGSAQEPLAAPLVGWLRDGGQLRAMYGIPGNFLPGPAVRDAVWSAAFSGTEGVVKTDSEVITLDRAGQPLRALAAPSGPALFAFDRAGHAEWCYFRHLRQLRHLAGGEDPANLSELSGSVLALGSDGGNANLLVSRGAELWRVTVSVDGQVLAEESLRGLPAGGPAAVSQDGTIVAADGAALVVRRPLAEDCLVALPARAEGLELMGEGWVRVGQPDGAPPLALHLTKAGVSVYRLPATGERP
jgi:hypothetical protein